MIIGTFIYIYKSIPSIGIFGKLFLKSNANLAEIIINAINIMINSTNNIIATTIGNTQNGDIFDFPKWASILKYNANGLIINPTIPISIENPGDKNPNINPIRDNTVTGTSAIETADIASLNLECSLPIIFATIIIVKVIRL